MSTDSPIVLNTRSIVRTHLRNARNFIRIRKQAEKRGDARTAAIAQQRANVHRARALQALASLRAMLGGTNDAPNTPALSA